MSLPSLQLRFEHNHAIPASDSPLGIREEDGWRTNFMVKITTGIYLRPKTSHALFGPMSLVAISVAYAEIPTRKLK